VRPGTGLSTPDNQLKGDSKLSDEQPLLFLTDPQRFWELVTTDDQQKRLDGLGVSDDLVLCEIVRYGFYNRQEMIGPLAKFYREWVMKMPEDRRFGLYRHIVGFVENTSVVSINAFLPFIAEDSSRMMVATAVIDYVSLGSLNLADLCGKLTVSVKGETPQNVDKSKLENGVYEPLREADLIE